MVVVIPIKITAAVGLLLWSIVLTIMITPAATDGTLECIVVGHSKSEGKSLVIYIQPLTGADLKPVQKLEVKLVQAALAPLVTRNHAQIVVAMDAQQAHTFSKVLLSIQ